MKAISISKLWVKKTIRLVLSLFVLFWLVFIFYLSNQPASVSAQNSFQMSQQILELIHEDPPVQKIRLFDNFLRNSAHFSVFFILALALWPLNRLYGVKRPYLITIILSFLYALSDEIHQIFVPGRAFELSDLILDFSGSLLALSLWFLWNLAYDKFKPKENTSHPL